MAASAAPTGDLSGQGWVNDALNGDGRWSLRTRVPYILGLIMLFDSWDSVVIAYILPTLGPEWQLSPLTSGWLISAGYAGQFVGAIVFGMLAERFGRMPVLTPLVVIFSLLALVCAMAGDFMQLIATRFIQGIAIGGALPVAICYVNEVAPTATRGKYFGTYQFLMLAGFGLASLASIYVVPYLGWRAMFVIGAMPLLFVPLLIGLPESPRWLAGRGRAEAAASSLAKLGAGSPVAPAADPLGAMVGTPDRASLAELFAPENRRKMGVTLVLWFFISLVSYGLLNWVPTIYVQMFDIPVQQALSFNSVVSISIFILPIVLRQSIDRVGRRPPVILGTFVAGVALLALIAAPRDGWALVVVLMVVGQIGISVGSIILWPYSAESFPTRIRSLALGLSSSTARAASMLTPLLVGGIIQLTGQVTMVFAVFGVFSLVVALLWWRATEETAGREIDP